MFQLSCHAVDSSLQTIEPAATFMLLPHRRGFSCNAYMSWLNHYPDTLAIGPSLAYAFAITPCTPADLIIWDKMIDRTFKHEHNLSISAAGFFWQGHHWGRGSSEQEEEESPRPQAHG
eukprot:376051-Pelagomonas_calceolata.AAC.1